MHGEFYRSIADLAPLLKEELPSCVLDVDFHRELTREGYKFPLRIDPCLTLLRFQLTGALWRSDQHGFIERCASLASS